MRNSVRTRHERGHRGKDIISVHALSGPSSRDRAAARRARVRRVRHALRPRVRVRRGACTSTSMGRPRSTSTRRSRLSSRSTAHRSIRARMRVPTRRRSALCSRRPASTWAIPRLSGVGVDNSSACKLTAPQLADLQRIAPLSWSTYRSTRVAGTLVFHQTVGKPSGGATDRGGLTGERDRRLPSACAEPRAVRERDE